MKTPPEISGGVFVFGCFISLTQAACRLRSAGAHFVRRAVALASARSVLRREYIKSVELNFWN